MPTPSKSATSSTFLILTLAAAAMAALLAFLPAAGHDQLWCLYVARHALDGSRLYGPELLESNPPLIIWLSMLPASLAHLTHIPAPAIGKALVVLLEALIAAVCLRLLPRVSRTQIIALAFVFVTLFNVVPARDLGQRDHLLALLCLPYILLAARRAESSVKTTSNFSSRPEAAPFAAAAERPASPARTATTTPLVAPSPQTVAVTTATLIGLTAGIGLALKPHQALIPIAIELYLILRHRSLRPVLRPEPLAILAVAVAYLTAIHTITPDYLTTVLPLLRDTYWAVGSLSLPQLILQAPQLHLLATAALTLWITFRRRPSVGCSLFPVPCLLVAASASTLAYYLQGTGWYYQQLPAITFFAFALAFQLLPLLDHPLPTWTPKAALALSLLALALTTHFMNYPFTEARSFPIETPDPAFFDHLAPGTPVATLTTTVDYTVMPADRFHLTIAQRYPHLWLLPAILRNEDPGPNPPRHLIPPARLAELDRLQHQFMTEDLAHWQPQLVLVERCNQPPGCQLLEDRRDDILTWFLRDPTFAAEWKSYTFIGTRGRYDAYARLSH